jgi:hypothetical protein
MHHRASVLPLTHPSRSPCRPSPTRSIHPLRSHPWSSAMSLPRVATTYYSGQRIFPTYHRTSSTSPRCGRPAAPAVQAQHPLRGHRHPESLSLPPSVTSAAFGATVGARGDCARAKRWSCVHMARFAAGFRWKSVDLTREWGLRARHTRQPF